VRPEKQYMVEDIRRQLTGSEFAFFLDYTRLTVGKMSSLREKLRGAGAETRVVKNRLLKVVCTKLGWADMGDVMRRPTALVTGKDDVAAARIILEFVRDDERPLKVKGGVVQGTFLKAAEIMEMASLPSRDVLRARLVGTIAAPMTRLMGVMNMKLASLVYVLKAIEKKKG